MRSLQRIIPLLDLFLSPDLRKMERADLVRLRFLVFAILFAIPCGFSPCLIFRSTHSGPLVWLFGGILNLLVTLLLLTFLRRSKDYHQIAMLSLAWMHVLFTVTLLALPALFSQVYLWSSCLIVISSLIFGRQGALLSSLGLTTISIGNILYQYENHTPWVMLGLDQYIEQLLIQLSSSTVLTAAVTGVYEYMRDSSDHHQARQRLIAARHAHTGAVGELVGHVAHEVNNPLAILQGSVTRLRRQLERGQWPHESRKLLLNMQRSHERIIKVQQALAVFASGNQHEPFVSFTIGSILKDARRAMLPQAQAQQVRLEFRDHSLPQALRCQPHQLVYVLCSLIQNALEACRDRNHAEIIVEACDAGSMLMLSVSDNGKGIEAEVQERIFQPFFTTKVGGNAQGLSLSVSRGILARHGGAIHFRSHAGATTFTCHIPREPSAELQLAKGA